MNEKSLNKTNHSRNILVKRFNSIENEKISIYRLFKSKSIKCERCIKNKNKRLFQTYVGNKRYEALIKNYLGSYIDIYIKHLKYQQTYKTMPPPRSCGYIPRSCQRRGIR